MDTPAAAKTGGSSTKTILIVGGSVIGVGLLAYLLFKPKAPLPTTVFIPGSTATNPLGSALGGLGTWLGSLFKPSTTSSTAVPPLIVTNWNAGTFNYTLGTMSGQVTPATPQGTPIKGANAGNYSIQVNDYDGTGYDIIAFNGTIQNSIYVTANGSFSFVGRPGNHRNFSGNGKLNFKK